MMKMNGHKVLKVRRVKPTLLALNLEGENCVDITGDKAYLDSREAEIKKAMDSPQECGERVFRFNEPNKQEKPMLIGNTPRVSKDVPNWFGIPVFATDEEGLDLPQYSFGETDYSPVCNSAADDDEHLSVPVYDDSKFRTN